MTVVREKQNTGVAGRAASASTSRALQIAGRALLIALVLLLAGLGAKIVQSAATSTTMFTYPFQFDESEGMIVAENLLLDRGTNIFLKPTPDLFVAAPYPPVYYLLTSPLQGLAAPDPTFKVGRGLTILAMLLAGVCLFGIVHALTGDWLAALLAPAVWWSLGLVTYWGSLVKPDMLALAFGLCGLWWVVARPPAQVWWALPFFWAAFFTKQTAIAAGIAVGAWLLAARFRTGVAWSAALAAGALVPTLLLNLWTDGGYYYHMYTIHDLPWFPGRFVDFSTELLSTYGVFLVPGMLAVLIVGGWCLMSRFGRARSPLPRAGGLLLLFYLGMALVAASGTGTHGGNHNHMLEWVAASCLGLGVGAALIRSAERWPLRAVGALLALVLLASVPALFSTPALLEREFRVLTPEYREGMQNVFQYVTNNGGAAYSDNVGLLLLARKRLWSTDPFTQTHATPRGRWDESKLVQAIKDKQFSQVILRIQVESPDAGAGDVSPGILQAVHDNYKLDQRNVENIYVPR